MKNTRLFTLIALPLVAGGLFFGLKSESVTGGTSYVEEQPKEIQWMSMSEALQANEKDKKLIFVDVYTDWCGWCKVMDRETFSKPEVVEYMSKNFYCVKLNSEKEAEEITINGNKFGLVDAGKRKIHTLAYALLDGRLSYPSYVFLNGDLQRLRISSGYKEVGPWMAELKQVVEGQM